VWCPLDGVVGDVIGGGEGVGVEVSESVTAGRETTLVMPSDEMDASLLATLAFKSATAAAAVTPLPPIICVVARTEPATTPRTRTDELGSDSAVAIVDAKLSPSKAEMVPVDESIRVDAVCGCMHTPPPPPSRPLSLPVSVCLSLCVVHRQRRSPLAPPRL